jgi:hypothetical protein
MSSRKLRDVTDQHINFRCIRDGCPCPSGRIHRDAALALFGADKAMPDIAAAMSCQDPNGSIFDRCSIRFTTARKSPNTL